VVAEIRAMREERTDQIEQAIANGAAERRTPVQP
jgi:hypothetical protein